MRRAEARRNASMMISNSIRRSLAGNDVDWITKTSAPRTFSWISTKISMSAKRRTTALVVAVPRWLPMASAKAGLELPATSLIAPLLPNIHALPPALQLACPRADLIQAALRAGNMNRGLSPQLFLLLRQWFPARYAGRARTLHSERLTGSPETANRVGYSPTKTIAL